MNVYGFTVNNGAGFIQYMQIGNKIKLLAWKCQFFYYDDGGAGDDNDDVCDKRMRKES